VSTARTRTLMNAGRQEIVVFRQIDEIEHLWLFVDKMIELHLYRKAQYL